MAAIPPNNDTTKFVKKIILNDYSFDMIRDCTMKLLYFMEEINQKYDAKTEFLKLRLKDSNEHIFAKELTLEWATPFIKDIQDGSDTTTST